MLALGGRGEDCGETSGEDGADLVGKRGRGYVVDWIGRSRDGSWCCGRTHSVRSSASCLMMLTRLFLGRTGEFWSLIFW